MKTVEGVDVKMIGQELESRMKVKFRHKPDVDYKVSVHPSVNLVELLATLPGGKKPAFRLWYEIDNREGTISDYWWRELDRVDGRYDNPIAMGKATMHSLWKVTIRDDINLLLAEVGS